MAPSLDQIVACARRRVSVTRFEIAVHELEKRAAQHSPRGFRRALQQKAETGVAVIAELKKASPSRGVIRDNFEPGLLATQMAASGAAALSVLTEEEFFQGSLDYLRIASSQSGLPCLRKDFIVDEWQLLEARAYRADAVLLIVAALSPAELNHLASKSGEFGLDVLCEVHDEDELNRALDAGCNLIGVNSRDLRTFQVDLNTALRLGRMIPKDVFSVAESGIKSGQDIARLRAEGYGGFLIGESLMRKEQPGEALRSLLTEAHATVAGT